jgi:hypothetical protein
LIEALETLKRRRSLHDEADRIKLLDKEIEKFAITAMCVEREKLFEELTLASLRVRTLTAQIHAARICLRETAEACKDPDVAARLMDQVNRWAAGSMPTCQPSIDDIQEGRGLWRRQFLELTR